MNADSENLTLSPFIHTTLGAGSPLIGISKRSLFPATTVTVLSGKFKLSKCTLGGSAEVQLRSLESIKKSYKVNRVKCSLCTNDVDFGRKTL